METKLFLSLGLILLLATPSGVRAQENTEVDQFLTSQVLSAGAGKSKPNIDAKRIINESNSFLKEREPEMNGEEYALYEKVVALLDSNADFAVKLLEAMMNDKEPPSPAFEFILGNAYYNAGDVAKAEARYRSAVERYPTFIRAWNNLGVLYYTADRYADAVPCFSKSIALGDRDPTTFGLLGYSLEKGEDYVSAEMAFMQALGGDPSNSDWKSGLLRICVAGNQNTRAESLVRSLIKENPAEPHYWLTYAGILLNENRQAEAMGLLEAAAGTGVAGPDELNLLGDLYASHDLLPEAVRIYQKLLATSAAGDGEFKLLHYAQVLVAAGKPADAQRVLDACKQPLTAAGQRTFLQTKADLLAAEKKWPEARQELETLLKVAPLDGKALLSLGRTYSAEGDLARASFAFESAYRVKDSTYAASLELANIELRNRHYAMSVKYLKRALSIEKSDAVEDYLARVSSLVENSEMSTP